MFEKPVMSKTSFTLGFMFFKTRFPFREVTLFRNKRNILKPWLDVYSKPVQSISMSGLSPCISGVMSC